jgi:CRP-like cAMP-binding protein
MVEAATLQKYPFFGGLLPEQIEEILPLMEEEWYEAGVCIIAEGQANSTLRFILEGRARAEKGGLLLAEFGKGDVFGEMEVLDVMPSTATIAAQTQTRILTLSRRALHTLYKTDTKVFSMIIMNLARDLSRRLRRMNDWVLQAEQSASQSPAPVP